MKHKILAIALLASIGSAMAAEPPTSTFNVEVSAIKSGGGVAINRVYMAGNSIGIFLDHSGSNKASGVHYKFAPDQLGWGGVSGAFGFGFARSEHQYSTTTSTGGQLNNCAACMGGPVVDSTTDHTSRKWSPFVSAELKKPLYKNVEGFASLKLYPTFADTGNGSNKTFVNLGLRASF